MVAPRFTSQSLLNESTPSKLLASTLSEFSIGSPTPFRRGQSRTSLVAEPFRHLGPSRPSLAMAAPRFTSQSLFNGTLPSPTTLSEFPTPFDAEQSILATETPLRSMYIDPETEDSLRKDIVQYMMKMMRENADKLKIQEKRVISSTEYILIKAVSPTSPLKPQASPDFFDMKGQMEKQAQRKLKKKQVL